MTLKESEFGGRTVTSPSRSREGHRSLDRSTEIASFPMKRVRVDSSSSRFETINTRHGIDMNLVHAQAYALFKGGFRFWFDTNEIVKVNERNPDYAIRRPRTNSSWNIALRDRPVTGRPRPTSLNGIAVSRSTPSGILALRPLEGH